MTATRQLRSNLDNRWDFLCGVLPGGINPTDIDLMYERRGHFLILEGKHTGARIHKGQKICLDALAAVPGVFVIHFYGTPPDQVEAFGVWPRPAHPGTTDDLIQLIKRWFAWVEATTRNIPIAQ